MRSLRLTVVWVETDLATSVEQRDNVRQRNHVLRAIFADCQLSLHKQCVEQRIAIERYAIAQRHRCEINARTTQRTPESVEDHWRSCSTCVCQAQLHRDKLLIDLLLRARTALQHLHDQILVALNADRVIEVHTADQN